MGLVTRSVAAACAVALLAAGCSSVPRPITTNDGGGDIADVSTADLLAGHLPADLPDGAVSEARRTSIMAAPQAAMDETRVVLEGGGPDGLARFVMMVSELYLLGSGDLRSDATRLAAKGERIVEVSGAKLPMFGIEPTSAPLPDRPVFVLGAIVGHPDGSLQEITFFILPEMSSERAAYADEARAILKTIGAGSRKLEAKGGRAKLGEGLALDMPPGYLLSSQPGPDFEVYRVRKLNRAGERGATLGVYVGGHPSLQHAQAARDGGPEPPTTTEAGSLLGKSTTWIAWATPDGVKIREAIVELGELRAVHVFALAAADEDMAVLEKIASSLAAGP